jgi:hypothetical protein
MRRTAPSPPSSTANSPIPGCCSTYHLRAALGARPQTAAAAATLAEALPAETESAQRDHLLRTAAATARELDLTWLNSALDR